MAKSSSNNDPCSRATQIIKALPASQCIIGPEENVLNGVSLSCNDFIKQMKGSGASSVTYKEECCFYLFWICRFLACTSSKRVINYYLPMARCLANGTPVDMSSFLLRELYRAMYPKEVPSFPTCFKLFNDSLRRRSPEEFMPFEARRSSNASVEAYCPSLVARQFGLVQLLPWETYMANFNNEDDLIEALQGCCPAFLLYQLAGASIEHMASYVTPQPLQQKSHSGKKVGDDPSSQKFATTEVSSNLLNNLIDIVTDRVIAHNAELAEVAFDLRNQLMKCCQANLLQDVAFKKAKEKVDPTVSPKGAKPSGKKLVKTVAKKSIAKKVKVVEAKQLAAALKAKAKAEDAERQRLEAEMEKKRQIDKAEEERIVEIERRTSIEAVTFSIEAAAPLAQNMPEGLGDIDKLLEDVSLTLQQCQTPTKASSTSIPLEPSKDQLQAVIDQLKELLQQPVGLVILDVNLVDQFHQVVRFFTAHSSALSESGKPLLGLFVQNLDSTISNLQAAQEKRNRATSQEADHKQRVSKLQAHQLNLQTKASELKSIDQKMKSLEAELQLWKSKCT
uniref:Aminotransferase-like plant mobile domain-containing protein n=1 Tax=Fagus sylvatica TaxID=28930 RepID=A0A2N9H3D1_FAGSY